ncbi:MAG: pyridoxal-phosphate dependent enzyme [Candidatus Delongbacteria bacterium]|nr:pyridoxal-phosphate dependent enzyme [Candidatus Cloacimonadota bacterium]MCB9474992.1 pyridoxal-phosphate dependent enzyme [Candidatus Delongbacteria bacterium]
MNRDKVLAATVARCREQNILIPTYRQMAHPELMPAGVHEELKQIGLWDINPRNLFRISWKNEPVPSGGGHGGVNHMVLPPELTGVPARIVVLLGRWFPTGAHKVGATFGPLVEKLVSGDFDPTTQKALWPSTGNYCRGGAFNSRLLGCPSIAVLPDEMSRERFEWLEEVGAEVIRTPGGESNVKEIYDKVHELKARHGDSIVVLNQFAEFGNPMWHYWVTGPAMEEVFQTTSQPGDRFSGLFLTQGSAGTLGSGDYLRTRFPLIKIGAGEALECPTLLLNGFGAHRIEGIGDKHVPWVHNMKNTDMVVDLRDEHVMRLLRLFNEPAGKARLIEQGVDPTVVSQLDNLGISGIANVLGAIKMARYWEMNSRDTLFTVATDSLDMYRSRLAEMNDERGEYTPTQAAVDFEHCLLDTGVDHLLELSWQDRKRMHNLKYFTWVEQQGKTATELNAQWTQDDYWEQQYSRVEEWDEKIRAFNERTGMAARYQ